MRFKLVASDEIQKEGEKEGKFNRNSTVIPI